MDLGSGIRKALARITGASVVDEAAVKELVKDLQRVLITNDVNVKLVFQLTKTIEEKALKEKLLPGLSLREHVVRVVHDELQKVLGGKFEPRLGKQKILVVGLFGGGKSTTAAKLAKFYQSKGLKVALVAADVHRPAAFDQLQQLSEQVTSGFYGIRREKNAVKIAEQSLKELEGKYDVLILDSAGRSAFDGELAEELTAVAKAFKPDEKFLVVSADLGQVAGKQAQEFHSTVGVTGVIVTKMDGSGKGGGALSSLAVTGAKVAFIRSEEKTTDLKTLHSTRFVAELVGFPDLASLLEKINDASDEEAVQKARSEEHTSELQSQF